MLCNGLKIISKLTTTDLRNLNFATIYFQRGYPDAAYISVFVSRIENGFKGRSSNTFHKFQYMWAN